MFIALYLTTSSMVRSVRIFEDATWAVLLKRQACGNSIPRVWDPHMRNVRLPWPTDAIREDVAGGILRAHEDNEEARLKEKRAIQMLHARPCSIRAQLCQPPGLDTPPGPVMICT